MARTRIIIAHPEKIGNRPPHVVYLGTSGSEADAAMKADKTAHHYEIFEGPGRRKSNASYDPAAAPSVAPAASVVIPDDVAGLKKGELQQALAAAILRIQELEASANKTPQQEEQKEQADEKTEG